MKSVLDNIRVIKVENGYVVNIGERTFIAHEEDGVKEIVAGEMPTFLKELAEKQKKESKTEPPQPPPETPAPNAT